MDTYNVVKASIYLLMTIIGVVGSVLILMFFAIIARRERHLAKAETILSHLAMANLIVYLVRSTPSVFYEYGWKDLFDTSSCKVVSLLYRVFRGMSIRLTCLLSCFQCAILSKTNVILLQKQTIHNSVNPLIGLLYLANLVENVDAIMMATKPFNATNLKYVFKPGFCLIIYPGKREFEAKGYSSFAFDLLFVILMALASFRIVLILQRHSKKMKAVRKVDGNESASAETQASKTVILLVSFYITFYGIDNTIWLSQIIFNEISQVVSDIRVFFTMCYGDVFPIVVSVFNNKIKGLVKDTLRSKAVTQ
ncbi:olfactory receptor class A-like protein 1 [Ambystoma mexicanum]|uniref:olfactory receptor class A-like protein 1 n=1 Tax=Ambystoma mexicanum TaxID=8296 RepID=UPI0037E6FE52